MAANFLQIFSLQIPQYCEDSHFGWIAEPMNAASSLAFLLAAVVGLRIWRREGASDRGTLLALIVVALIGVGALAFHSLRTPLTLLADIVPIMVFMLVIFTLILTRAFGQSAIATMAHLTGFLALNMMVMLILTPRALGYGAWYVVPLFVLYTLGVSLILRARVHMHENRDLRGEAAARSDREAFADIKLGYALVLSGVLLAAGILARAYDLATCGMFPVGLHVVWHLLAAGAVFVLTLGCVRHLPKPRVQVASRLAATPSPQP